MQKTIIKWSLVIVLYSGTVLAEEDPHKKENYAAESDPQSAPGDKVSPLPERGELLELNQIKIPWTETTGRGLGIGIDNGYWGGMWSIGLKTKFPFGPGEFGRHFGVDIRGIVLQSDGENDETEGVWHIGGRLGFYSQSDVFLNIIRLYGGGGVQYFHNVSNAKSPGWGGGGYAGFEFFWYRAMSSYIEIGGNSTFKEGSSSATIVAGIKFYPFSI